VNSKLIKCHYKGSCLGD